MNDVTKSIENIIGVKQGDILGPLLFIFHLAAVMITWRVTHEQPLCIFYTKMDDVLTERRYNTVRNSEKFTLPDFEYADDTAVLFPSREDVEYSAPHLLAHVSKFDLEIHVGTPEKSSKSIVLFVSAPNRTYTNPLTYDGCNLDYS